MPSAEMGKVAGGDSVTEEVSFPARGSEMPKGDRVSAVGTAQSGVQETWAGDVKWKHQYTRGFEVKRRLDREDDAGLSPSAPRHEELGEREGANERAEKEEGLRQAQLSPSPHPHTSPRKQPGACWLLEKSPPHCPSWGRARGRQGGAPPANVHSGPSPHGRQGSSHLCGLPALSLSLMHAKKMTQRLHRVLARAE